MGLLMRLAMGWNGPRQPILGTECSGVVTAVGANVTRFRVGDAVVAFPGVAIWARTPRFFAFGRTVPWRHTTRGR